MYLQENYHFYNIHPHKPRAFKIYQLDLAKNTSKFFTKAVLQNIKDSGYNTLYLLNIQANTNGQISYPLLVNPVFGSPSDAKKLIDEAHEIGIYVIVDILQSRAEIGSEL